MNYKTIKNYDDYIVYENGDIYNINRNNKMKYFITNNICYIKLSKNEKRKTFVYSRLVYNHFNDIELKSNETIKFKDNNNLNFHYENMEKILLNNFNIKQKKTTTILDTNKKWTIIKDYSNYKISNFGDIFSIKNDKILKVVKDLNSYLTICLTNINGRKKFFVHRLVYDNFIGLKNIDNVIDHIDRNKQNNNIDNLREVTKSINCYNKVISTQRQNKISQFTLDGKFIKEWESLNKINQILKYKISSISACCLGKYKCSYGFIWKNMNTIENVDEYKQISKIDGEVFSNYRINKKGDIINKNNILLKHNIKQGYYEIELISDSKKAKKIRIHKLVATTFLDNPHNYKVINHIDENKLNNDIDNLEWCTYKHNARHSLGIKINQIDIKTHDIIETFNSITDAYKKIKKTRGSNIVNVCKGIAKSAYGFKWEFA